MAKFFDKEQLDNIDDFDKFGLIGTLKVCLQCKSMAQAGRLLFAHSRLDKKVSNDSDRVKKYLARFGLTWADIEKVTLK